MRPNPRPSEIGIWHYPLTEKLTRGGALSQWFYMNFTLCAEEGRLSVSR